MAFECAIRLGDEARARVELRGSRHAAVRIANVLLLSTGEVTRADHLILQELLLKCIHGDHPTRDAIAIGNVLSTSARIDVFTSMVDAFDDELDVLRDKIVPFVCHCLDAAVVGPRLRVWFHGWIHRAAATAIVVPEE